MSNKSSDAFWIGWDIGKEKFWITVAKARDPDMDWTQ